MKTLVFNPRKPQIGRIAEQILENVNNVVRSKTKYNQWTSTPDVTTWFNKIENKLGLNWAKLSSSWYWTLPELSLAKFLVKF